ncbi:MAG: hypothetical protein AB2L07_22160 [Thermoanaerobaculaceae bacterium]
MGSMAQHNFHVPMPAEMYRDLRAEAERRGVPATALVRQVLEEWLEAHRRLVVAEAIAAYAAGMAGTSGDLDPELETAAVESLERDGAP